MPGGISSDHCSSATRTDHSASLRALDLALSISSSCRRGGHCYGGRRRGCCSQRQALNRIPCVMPFAASYKAFDHDTPQPCETSLGFEKHSISLYDYWPQPLASTLPACPHTSLGEISLPQVERGSPYSLHKCVTLSSQREPERMARHLFLLGAGAVRDTSAPPAGYLHAG
jgi:hypothetical protein